MTRFTELMRKDVINVCDCKCLGCVCDVIINVCTGQVEALVIPGRRSISEVFKCFEIVIKWNRIERIGDDIILVRLDSGIEQCCEERKRKFGFF